MTRFRFGRWGMLDNPIGADVTWQQNGRKHLARVYDIYRRETPQAYMLRVRYFNGEDAGEVAASAVEVLVREYEAANQPTA